MEEKNNEIKNCPHCGHEMTADKKFCPVCLKPMPEEEPPEAIAKATEAEVCAPAEQGEEPNAAAVTADETTATTESSIPASESAAGEAEAPPASDIPSVDPEQLRRELEEHKARKKQKRKKIIIGSVIGAAVLILGIILIVIATADRISFNKSTAQAYDTYGLTCYAPEGWNQGSLNDQGDIYIGSYYCSEEDDSTAIAYTLTAYLGEFDKFNDVLDAAEDELGLAVGKYTKTSVDGCKNAVYGEYRNDSGQMCCGYIVLCDRSGFYLWGSAIDDLYDAEVFNEIILASDFNRYDSKNICDYLDGHEVEEWEETVPSTCTEKGTEAGKCTVCLQTIERELDLIPHEVEEGETVESTCVEKGSVTGTCSICGEEITEELPLADHTPGDWIVDKEATESTEGTHHKECTVCGKKLESESFTLSLEEIKETYNTGITYNQLSREPDEYKDKKVKFSGRVLQVIEGDYSTSLRVATKGRYDNVIYITYLKGFVDSRILEDDTITVYGTFAELYTYKSTGSGYITIPRISVDYIDQ